MILLSFCMPIKLQTVLIIFISALLIIINKKGSVVSVLKGGLDLIVIKLFAIQIYGLKRFLCVNMEFVMDLIFVIVKLDGKEISVIWLYAQIVLMDFVHFQKIVTASMVGQVLIVLKLLVFHHALMELLLNLISVNVMMAGKVVLATFLLVLMDAETEIVKIVKFVNVSLVGIVPQSKLLVMQNIVLKPILDADIVLKIIHLNVLSVSLTTLLKLFLIMKVNL